MKTFVVENGVQASEMIAELTSQGYTKDEIYLFAHDLTRSKHLTEHTDTNNIGLTEEGIFDKIARVFRSRGEDLQIRMASIGLSQSEAVRLEEELDDGKVVIVAQ
ncbi:general stress protein [Metabacillus litoralis]|uniref:general stress protein n=1 Tax=Metabacillus litoralis TaxID=152268 RepID=UPI001CFEA236|nr:general stress protein [Metabacillus litoralis]